MYIKHAYMQQHCVCLSQSQSEQANLTIKHFYMQQLSVGKHLSKCVSLWATVVRHMCEK